MAVPGPERGRPKKPVVDTPAAGKLAVGAAPEPHQDGRPLAGAEPAAGAASTGADADAKGTVRTQGSESVIGDTQRLVRRVAQGPDANAWEALSHKVIRYLRERFGRAGYPPGQEFDDLVSDVIARVMGAIRSFEDRGQGSFWKWIQTIAGNVYLDMWRAHGRTNRHFVADATLAPADDSSPGFALAQRRDPKQETPSVIVSTRELEAAERDCVARLSGQARMVYLLRRQQDLSFAEISAQLGGIKEVTLRSHFKRAREIVRECLCHKLDHLAGQLQVEAGGWTEAGDGGSD